MVLLLPAAPFAFPQFSLPADRLRASLSPFCSRNASPPSDACACLAPPPSPDARTDQCVLACRAPQVLLASWRQVLTARPHQHAPSRTSGVRASPVFPGRSRARPSASARARTYRPSCGGRFHPRDDVVSAGTLAPNCSHPESCGGRRPGLHTVGVDRRRDQRGCVSTRRPRPTPGRPRCLTRPPCKTSGHSLHVETYFPHFINFKRHFPRGTLPW